MIRTRFAPSPTGVLHLGSVRTALFCWLYAKHTKGQFILRIEDTDQERSTRENVDAILEGMTWLGMECDEGPLYQTDRFARYQEIANDWLKSGKAYRCYCTKDQLDEMRNQQKEKGEKTFTIGGKEYDVEEALATETNKNDKSDDGEGMDAVQPKAVKKKFADRKDKDIDNDGDVDDSDKFLHKRRKAVSKSMKEDTVADSVRAMWEAAAKKADGKTEEDDDEDEKKKTIKGGDTTMTGKPMSKVQVSPKEKD